MIQRWHKDAAGEYPHHEGRYVLYEDHVAALNRIRQYVLDSEEDGEYCKVVHSCGLLDFINGGAVHDR